MALDEGKKAPAFSLKDQAGQTVKLAELKGHYVVVYFYPKDDTPGCTVEACSFRDEHTKLQKAGAVVLGVSPDDEKSHQKFIKKHSLPFQLLVDADHAMAEKYGAWGEKNMYGKKYMGILRSTVLIDPEGKVAKVWPKVKPDGHAEDVLASIKAHAKG
jgi:thioredoxin-dependent peroxiredoxin